jgi:hypothetical protein
MCYAAHTWHWYQVNGHIKGPGGSFPIMHGFQFDVQLTHFLKVERHVTRSSQCCRDNKVVHGDALTQDLRANTQPFAQ